MGFEASPLEIPEGSLKTARLFPETALETSAEHFLEGQETKYVLPFF